MIAAPTGPASGVWALDPDVDPVKQLDGIAVLNQLVAQHGPLPQTLTSITPRGGKHLFFFLGTPTSIFATARARSVPASMCAAMVATSSCRRAATAPVVRTSGTRTVRGYSPRPRPG